jgi:phytoene dehydrogenase-like protein
MTETWDAIVIGSGMGGMTAAGLLAGAAGRKVLVLEKHSEPGGLTHVFRRDGASWDVGLHYVGEMEKGTLARSLMDFLSAGRLRWNKMPEDFERFVYPGLTFKVPSDPVEFEKRLIDRFPAEQKGISRYFKDIRRVQGWNVRGFVSNFMPKFLGLWISLGRRLGYGMATQTTGAYLQKRFRSPQLRALLASQWGDYGLPPSRSAFAIHATIVSHYLHGAGSRKADPRVLPAPSKGASRHGAAACVSARKSRQSSSNEGERSASRSSTDGAPSLAQWSTGRRSSYRTRAHA